MMQQAIIPFGLLLFSSILYLNFRPQSFQTGFAGWTAQQQLDNVVGPCPGPFKFSDKVNKQSLVWMTAQAGTISAENNYYGSNPYSTRSSVCAATSAPDILTYSPPYPPVYDTSSPTWKQKFGPSWQSLQANNPTFSCPSAKDPDAPLACTHCTDPNKKCDGGSQENPLCPDMIAQTEGCCCPNVNCITQPQFNWIIGICQGRSCNGAFEETPNLKEYKNVGTQLIINYVAAYNFDDSDNTWQIAKDSSFNTDGSRPAYDTLQAYGGMSQEEAWLTPMPSGSVQWGTGFFPTGAEGLGPLASTKSTPELKGKSKGMMFVLSTEKSFNFAWYMLNQVTLDRGPGSPNCDGLNNCWASGNAGEIDFLESPFAANQGNVDNYRRLYLNNINQFGRCFPSQVYSDYGTNANGGWGAFWETSAYMLGSDPTVDKDEPLVYVAVIDSVGVWVYRIPSADMESEIIWKGLNRKNAAETLSDTPRLHPEKYQPCEKNSGYCVIFIPNCQGTEWGGPASTNNPKGAQNMGCGVNGQQGFCNNWFQSLTDTKQWQFDSQSKTWSRGVSDPVYLSTDSPRCPDGTLLCPDGKPSTNANCVETAQLWCQKQPWNRKMAPYLCSTAYGENCTPVHI